MISKFLVPFVLVASASVFNTGCTTVNSAERSMPQALKNSVDLTRVTTDPSLKRKVYVVGMNESYVSGNMLKVQAELQNKTNSYQEFYYTFDWFDVDGMLVSSPTGGWRPSGIQARELKAITAVAPTPKTVDFRLKLKE
jgi:uncharacterized protein YcfL